ncbi:MAG TPA: hypothetical protein VH370_07905 [Humisphaera sp.]|jgi:hypothetical protein|nr:hypothetical protein [Humisphaera sp.]
MTIQLPTSDLKAAFTTTLSTAIAAEKQLGADAQAAIARLIDELYPLVTAEAQALLTATNPAVPQTYLAVLQGCVDAAIAKLGLQAISQQRQLLASALQTGIQIVALVLRAVVVA